MVLNEFTTEIRSVRPHLRRLHRTTMDKSAHNDPSHSYISESMKKKTFWRWQSFFHREQSRAVRFSQWPYKYFALKILCWKICIFFVSCVAWYTTCADFFEILNRMGATIKITEPSTPQLVALVESKFEMVNLINEKCFLARSLWFQQVTRSATRRHTQGERKIDSISVTEINLYLNEWHKRQQTMVRWEMQINVTNGFTDFVVYRYLSNLILQPCIWRRFNLLSNSIKFVCVCADQRRMTLYNMGFCDAQHTQQ